MGTNDRSPKERGPKQMTLPTLNGGLTYVLQFQKFSQN